MSKDKEPSVTVVQGEIADRIIAKLERISAHGRYALNITRAILRDPIGFGVEYGKLQMRHAAKAQRAGDLRTELRKALSIIRDLNIEVEAIREQRDEARKELMIGRRTITELQRALHGSPSELPPEELATKAAGLAANLRNGTDGQALPVQGGE